MSNEFQWLIGELIALVGLIGGIIARDRQLMNKISDGDEKLHDRITKVQAEYVRRDDLNGHIQSIENSVNQMREEQRETNRRIDMLLTSLSKEKV